jgi:DNA-binding transcriptional regulator YdaS (Cro superfamily)
VSASTAGLLRAASEIVGGNKALADRLGIGEALLSKFMADSCELPMRCCFARWTSSS